MSSRGEKLVKNTAVLSLGTFLPKLAVMITLPILTGCLTKAEYGTYDLIVNLVSLILPAETLQIQTAAFRFLIDVRGKEKEIKSIITNILVFIIPTSIIALIIMFFCLYSLSFVMRIWICVYFFADILAQAVRQVARGLNDNLGYSISAIVNGVGKIVFDVILVMFFDTGLEGAVVALAISSIASFVFLVIKSKLYRYIDLKCVSKAELKELLKYSWPMVPNSMSMWVVNFSDRFVITSVMGVAANAVYSAATKIPQILTVAQSTFTMAWQESASIASKDDDADAYYSSIFKVVFNVIAGFMGLLIGFTPLLFMILIRGDYDEAYNQIPILFMGMFFYSLSAYLGGIYVAQKATKSVGITTIAAAICNLAINISLIHWIGLYAGSISTLVSFVVLYVYRMINLRKSVKMKYDHKYMIAIIIALGVMCFLCFQRNFILNCVNCVIGITAFFVLNRGLIKAMLKKAKKMLSKKK
ncbi:MAG: oligosaccharide flippase family protein [Ruminococcus sp.]|nr:oligosaccharide flippase family protein [Ruminococcus sp.]